ncbi:CASP-like protein 1F1 [Rhodamnia argentea]|uniref:CASP-like protein n=1 Tax=Rhodamnia argentea TaxID=178133 RepID=A0A8B8PBQ6_9MYRT|nr:CASP-like protein 1F1 [Rhodamnia argentea]
MPARIPAGLTIQPSITSMAIPEIKVNEQNLAGKSSNVSNGAQICLRILSIATTLAATSLMVTCRQSITVFGIRIDARYSYSSAFKFFAFANATACAFSMMSLFLLIIFTHPRGPRKPSNFFFFLFLHDLWMMSLVLAGCAAATAIGFVGKYGNNHTGWMPICDHLEKFCSKATTSIVFAYASLLLFMLLAILTAWNIRQLSSVALTS